jgi:hypothetical protein
LDEKAKCLILKDVRAGARVSVADMLLSKRPRMLSVTLPSLPKPDFTAVTTSENKVSIESKNPAQDITEDKTGKTTSSKRLKNRKKPPVVWERQGRKWKEQRK